MELACSLRSALGHPLHYLYFEFQYCVNLKTQSETGHSHADVSAPLRAMNLLLLVQTEVPPIPARGSAGAISSLCKEEALAGDGAVSRLPSLCTMDVLTCTPCVFRRVPAPMCLTCLKMGAVWRKKINRLGGKKVCYSLFSSH